MYIKNQKVKHPFYFKIPEKLDNKLFISSQKFSILTDKK